MSRVFAARYTASYAIGRTDSTSIVRERVEGTVGGPRRAPPLHSVEVAFEAFSGLT
jgi:hypothetical protein